MAEEGVFAETPGEKEFMSSARRDRQCREGNKEVSSTCRETFRKAKPRISSTWPLWLKITKNIFTNGKRRAKENLYPSLDAQWDRTRTVSIRKRLMFLMPSLLVRPRILVYSTS